MDASPLLMIDGRGLKVEPHGPTASHSAQGEDAGPSEANREGPR